MFDTKTIDFIKQAIACERENAKKCYGEKYASNHEAWAVLLEEFEETSQAMRQVESNVGEAWENIKANALSKDSIVDMRKNATLLVLESIQMCAVLDKWRES